MVTDRTNRLAFAVRLLERVVNSFGFALVSIGASVRFVVLLAVSTVILLGLPNAAGSEHIGSDTETTLRVFEDVSFGFELGNGGGYIKKWSGPIRIAFSVSSNAKSLLPGHVNHIDRLLSVFSFGASKITGLEIGFDQDNPNLLVVFFDSPSELTSFTSRENPDFDIFRRAGEHLIQSTRHTCVMTMIETGGLIEAAFVFVPVSVQTSKVLECLAEELAQSLGPANDTAVSASTIMNDANNVATLTELDWLMLELIYNDNLRPGSAREEAMAVVREQLIKQ